MSAPVNTARVINHIMRRDPVITNDILIKLAGGSHEQWSGYMRGQKAQCIVYSVNPILAEDNYMLVSEGMKTKRWRRVTVAEGHRIRAEFNLSRIDRPFMIAFESIEKIALDKRASKRLRNDAEAWMQLFEEKQPERGLIILRGFADEMIRRLEGKKEKPLALVQAS